MAHITPTPSACWGADCGGATPVFNAVITPTPTLQFAAPPECLDPGNIWIVTTSCYITSPQYEGPDSTPEWLQCSVTNFGAPDWNDPSCYLPAQPKTTQGTETVFYDGCPSGYTAVMTESGPGYNTYEYTNGHFDITYYTTGCCPTGYGGFQSLPIEMGESTTTVHDGQTFGVFLYPPPGCHATSVAELSGKAVPMYTTSNTMGWDRKRQLGDFPTTTLWAYETGTLLAQMEQIGNTVFEGTHTCYESCSTWFSYYYPDGTGGPEPTATSSTTTSTTATAAVTTATTTTPPSSGSSINTPSTTTGAATSGNASTLPAASGSGANAVVHSLGWQLFGWLIIAIVVSPGVSAHY